MSRKNNLSSVQDEIEIDSEEADAQDIEKITDSLFVLNRSVNALKVAIQKLNKSAEIAERERILNEAPADEERGFEEPSFEESGFEEIIDEDLLEDELEMLLPQRVLH